MPEAYCGPAPRPDTLGTSWNIDLTAIAISLAIFAFWRLRRGGSGQSLTLALALWLALFITPFCALTVALFSARVAHHLLVIAVVAPLLALALPQSFSRRLPLSLTMLVALHAVAVWLWHAPPIYAEAIGHPLIYWTMQLSLLGTGFALWQRVLAGETPLGSSLLALIATIVQMGMLGALLTFAGEPLYAAHLSTTHAFGLSPLHDQQLAGLLMWVPAALPYLLAAALLLGKRLGHMAAPAMRP